MPFAVVSFLLVAFGVDNAGDNDFWNRCILNQMIVQRLSKTSTAYFVEVTIFRLARIAFIRLWRDTKKCKYV